MAETLETACAAAARAFRQAGIETPGLDARLLLCHAAGLTHEAYVACPDIELGSEAAARLEISVARRLRREPVSRIIGVREFYGRRFRVDRHGLDPRPDTEILIEAALALVEQNGWRQRKLKLLDLGTGTGCILVTLLAELPHAEGIGTDMSEAGLALAAANAQRLGVAGRASFIAADWLDPIDGTFDLILSNPPYIAAGEIAGLASEVAGHDPRLALDGGPDGLDAYRRIAARVPEVLRRGGSLMVEIGAGQGDAVPDLFRAAGLVVEDDGVRCDLAGRPRCVMARRSGGDADGRGPEKRDLENHGVRVSFMPAE